MIQTESVSYPKNRWYILAILNLGLIIVMLNNLTLNVALPELSTDLNADNSELQWIMDSYVLVFAKMDEVEIEYSWNQTGDERDEFVYEDEDGFWAKNRVTISLDRKEAKSLYADNYESIEIDSDFESWRTGNVAIDVTFDTRIQDDLIKAELVSGPLTLIILGIVFGTLIAALIPLVACLVP